MTDNQNTEKFVVKQEAPFVQDGWGIIYGTDPENLKTLYKDPPYATFAFFVSKEKAKNYIKNRCPKSLEEIKIYYEVIQLRAFFAELLPVEVKADGK
jgi:hypothetical protein